RPPPVQRVDAVDARPGPRGRHSGSDVVLAAAGKKHPRVEAAETELRDRVPGLAYRLGQGVVVDGDAPASRGGGADGPKTHSRRGGTPSADLAHDGHVAAVGHVFDDLGNPVIPVARVRVDEQFRQQTEDDELNAGEEEKDADEEEGPVTDPM